MAGFSLFGLKLLNSRAENEMKDFFNRYEKILAGQKTKALDDITEWGDQLIVNIQRHVEKQKFSLEQDYKNQMDSLNNACKKFIDELHVHEEMNDIVQINQLVDRCNALRFKLASIQYHGQNVPFISLTREDVEFENSEKINETDTKNYTTASYDYDAGNNRNSYTNTLSNSSFQGTTQTCTSLPVASSSNNYIRSASSNSDQNSRKTKNDDSSEKCPVCFMIFPQTMLARDRQQHIHEHYIDD